MRLYSSEKESPAQIPSKHAHRNIFRLNHNCLNCVHQCDDHFIISAVHMIYCICLSQVLYTIFINGRLAILKHLKCLRLKKELNNKNQRSCQNESLYIVLGLYSHLTRSYRDLKSGKKMKARLLRLCCDFPYKCLKFE